MDVTFGGLTVEVTAQGEAVRIHVPSPYHGFAEMGGPAQARRLAAVLLQVAEAVEPAARLTGEKED